MIIYLWEIPEIPNKLIGAYQDEYVGGSSPDRYLFYKGIKLTKEQISPVPNIQFEVSKNRLEVYDCLISNATTPIVSLRLANLLMNLAHEDIQLFDVKIECTDGELKGYQLLNVAQKIKGIDHERSLYTTQKLVGGGR